MLTISGYSQVVDSLEIDNGVFYFKENKRGKITGFQLAYFSIRIDFEKVAD